MRKHLWEGKIECGKKGKLDVGKGKNRGWNLIWEIDKMDFGQMQKRIWDGRENAVLLVEKRQK